MTGREQRLVTPLAERLTERIALQGPLTVADYMQACLHDPEYGYYRRQMAIGRSGDFVTAPEISQVFGELIGLWCAIVWQQMGSPGRLRLIELGPGRGTLMRDGLRAARLVPEFLAALQVELVETNSALEPLQRATLAGIDAPMAWTSDLAGTEDPVILIANEFLDTLPVAQWVWRDGAWHTRTVGMDGARALCFLEGDAVPTPLLPAGIGAPRDGDTFESRAPSFADLAGKLARLGSTCAALFIDYGHTQPGFGDTLQAIAGHRYADPLQAPGQADITAQVDFAAFAATARASGLSVDGPVPQGEFLGALGAIERASRLMAMNPGQASQIETSIARLMSPGGMGSRFQAIGVRSENISPLPGLGAVDMARAGT
jgi:NADH dehydrogenase [ubiquinone] 1 alpha subcomplex assembly factor 7